MHNNTQFEVNEFEVHTATVFNCDNDHNKHFKSNRNKTGNICSSLECPFY